MAVFGVTTGLDHYGKLSAKNKRKMISNWAFPLALLAILSQTMPCWLAFSSPCLRWTYSRLGPKWAQPTSKWTVVMCHRLRPTHEDGQHVKNTSSLPIKQANFVILSSLEANLCGLKLSFCPVLLFSYLLYFTIMFTFSCAGQVEKCTNMVKNL